MKKLFILLMLISGVVYGEEFIISTWTYNSTVIKITPARAISFHDEDDNEVGSIDFISGPVVFEGNIDESARIFFEYFAKEYFGPYCENRENK